MNSIYGLQISEGFQDSDKKVIKDDILTLEGMNYTNQTNQIENSTFAMADQTRKKKAH